MDEWEIMFDAVQTVVQLETCFAASIRDPFDKLFGKDRGECVYHNVRELEDEILSWNRVRTSVDYHGRNGELLWLALGSLALLEPLRDIGYCRSILRGRSKLYLLTGFEEIFSYLVTVTPGGIKFEKDWA